MTTTYNVYQDGVLVENVAASPRTITGLTNGQQYSFEVARVVDGVEGPRSAAVLATPAVPEATTYPPDTTLSYFATPALARPAYLTPESTFPVIGTKVRRISNVHAWRNAYVSQVSFSKNSDRLIFFPGGGLRVIRTSDWVDIGPMSSGVDICHWSNLTNALLYGTQIAAGEIRTTTGVPGVPWQAYATIAGYPYLSMNYGALSDNDWVALIANTASNGSGSWRVYVYDLTNKVIKGYVDPGFQPSAAQISMDGNYVIVDRPANGAQYAYSVPGSNTACTPMAGGSYGASGQVRANGSHYCMAKLADGTSVSVSLAEGGIIRRLDNNAGTALFTGTTAFNDGGAGGHVSFTNRDYPGWVLLSTGVASSYPGHEQIVAVKLDGSGVVRVYAHAHACNVASPAGFYATPFAISNRDMTKVVWGSAWDGNESSQVYCFVAGMGAV